MLTEQERGVLTQDEADLADILHGTDIHTWAKYVPPLVKALAGARLRIRELEGEVAGWKSAVETVEAQRDDARLRIRELEEALRETDAKLGVCERDYEAMCETASREIERKNRAIEAAELLEKWCPHNVGPSTVREHAKHRLAEAKGTP